MRFLYRKPLFKNVSEQIIYMTRFSKFLLHILQPLKLNAQYFVYDQETHYRTKTWSNRQTGII